MRRQTYKRIGGFVIGLALIAAMAAAVMLLWNWLVPSIIGWTEISFLQALGLMVLTRLLLGGMPHRYGMAPWGARRRHHRQMRHLGKKMHGMSHEERHEFIRRHMAGFGGPDAFDKFESDVEERQDSL